MKTKIVIGLSVLSLATAALAVNEPAIIPQPQSLTRLEGSFKLAEDMTIYTDAAAAETGRMLAGKFRQATGWQIRVSNQPTPDVKITDGILLTTAGADAALGPEGYE